MRKSVQDHSHNIRNILCCISRGFSSLPYAIIVPPVSLTECQRRLAMKKEKSCGAVIYRNTEEGIRYLVIRQVQGHWCFPKGHIEKGETEEETAEREILEETGMSVSFVNGFRYVLSYSPQENVMKDVVYFLAEYLSGEGKAQEEEVSTFAWMDEAQTASTLTYENDRQLFAAARKFMQEEKGV